MPVLNEILATRLKKQSQIGLARTLTITQSADSVMISRGGKPLINFSGNDYLGLRTHPRVIAAARVALDAASAGSGASRLVTGNHDYYAPLEQALASAKHQEAALVFGSGYLANIGTISALMGKNDLIVADKLVHACMIDGAVLSGAMLKRFAHNDVAHAEQLLAVNRGKYEHCLILTESIFSMDGDAAPLEALVALAKTQDAWLMVDDAHGLDIQKPANADIWLGTLSKSLGSYGGYIAGSKILCDYLIANARSAIFSTALPPATLAAAHAALDIAIAEPERANTAMIYATQFAAALSLPAPNGAIVPLIIGEPEATVRASSILADAGFFVQAIRPPTVPPATSRLRFTFSAAHSQAQIDALIAFTKTLKGAS